MYHVWYWIRELIRDASLKEILKFYLSDREQIEL